MSPQEPAQTVPPPPAPYLPVWDEAWEPFMNWLGAVLSLDLHAYKPHQIRRRLLLYGNAAGFAHPVAYQAHLERHPESLQRLAERLLISTSTFFRDPELWQEFERVWLDDLLHSAPMTSTLRVWSVACAAGQEVYSLAVLLAEHQALPRVHLIGSDWSQRAIQQAQCGLYRREELEPAWLRLYPHLQPVGADWQFSRVLRQTIEWRAGDLFCQPFPAHCDLILCRNLLIYLSEGAQRRLVRRLMAALRPGGLLWTGKSERLSQWQPLGRQGLSQHLYRASSVC